ncbi:GNAT family N-acetyltransferase [Pseudarthrobacter sp. YS3]|uniref:GNAT family N-acetyltransferase n=1 Tax=Pseudarthrobacter sp. YS3 TaxID=3453718 RepID=UPI003EE9B9F8
MTGPTLPGLEVLMDAAWPAPDRAESAGWVLRAASGVTQRANSVWVRVPDGDPHHQRTALREARLWYRALQLPLIFQVFTDHRSVALNAMLDNEGFTRQSETLIMTLDSAGAGHLEGGPAGVEISGTPSEDWLQLWWSVDGRGGPAGRETARDILVGCPALYALVRDDDGVPAAVGRLAVPDGEGGSGGIYCMATSPDARRRGHATRILQGLLRDGEARGLSSYWLLVMASNAGALELYIGAGFTEAGRYLYRQERPKRHLTGC